MKENVKTDHKKYCDQILEILNDDSIPAFDKVLISERVFRSASICYAAHRNNQGFGDGLKTLRDIMDITKSAAMKDYKDSLI